jgi:hypothetical protein
MSRWFLFFLAICAGIVLGLLYGWYVAPVEYVNTSPESLSIPYKADYVLMVAEVYAQERDLAWAEERLEVLGKPVDIVELATRSAEPVYQAGDLALMRQLLQDLRAAESDREAARP